MGWWYSQRAPYSGYHSRGTTRPYVVCEWCGQWAYKSRKLPCCRECGGPWKGQASADAPSSPWINDEDYPALPTPAVSQDTKDAQKAVDALKRAKLPAENPAMQAAMEQLKSCRDRDFHSKPPGKQAQSLAAQAARLQRKSDLKDQECRKHGEAVFQEYERFLSTSQERDDIGEELEEVKGKLAMAVATQAATPAAAAAAAPPDPPPSTQSDPKQLVQQLQQALSSLVPEDTDEHGNVSPQALQVLSWIEGLGTHVDQVCQAHEAHMAIQSQANAHLLEQLHSSGSAQGCPPTPRVVDADMGTQEDDDEAKRRKTGGQEEAIEDSDGDEEGRQDEHSAPAAPAASSSSTPPPTAPEQPRTVNELHDKLAGLLGKASKAKAKKAKAKALG